MRLLDANEKAEIINLAERAGVEAETFIELSTVAWPLPVLDALLKRVEDLEARIEKGTK